MAVRKRPADVRSGDFVSIDPLDRTTAREVVEVNRQANPVKITLWLGPFEGFGEIEVAPTETVMVGLAP